MHPQSDFRDPVGAVSIQEKKDCKSQSFFEMLVLGAQSTVLDVRTHFESLLIESDRFSIVFEE